MGARKIIKIGKKSVGGNQPVFIIAEAGVNHNGRLDLAFKLIDAAAEAGADAVKFQNFKAEQLVTDSAEMAEYQIKNIGKEKSQFSMLKKLELKDEFYPKLKKYAEKKGLIFLSTPHSGFRAVDFLRKLKVPAFKFGSGELTNLPLLEYAAKIGKPMILGTGMATMKEVEKAVKTIKKADNKKIILLHCVTEYPCPVAEVNLRAMLAMKERLGILVGYSDHTLGSQVAVMAAFLGACVIEKHLTLDKKMKGPDHKISAEPKEFEELVKQIRDITTILGRSLKRPAKNEIKIRAIVRKSIVASKDIKKGERFTMENITIKRPGTGISPEKLHVVLASTAGKDISKDTVLDEGDLV